MNYKYLAVFLICLFSLTLLTGCYSMSDVETKAYAIAIGIDKSNVSSLRITIQFAVLNSAESSMRFITKLK